MADRESLLTLWAATGASGRDAWAAQVVGAVRVVGFNHPSTHVLHLLYPDGRMLPPPAVSKTDPEFYDAEELWQHACPRYTTNLQCADDLFKLASLRLGAEVYKLTVLADGCTSACVYQGINITCARGKSPAEALTLALIMFAEGMIEQ